MYRRPLLAGMGNLGCTDNQDLLLLSQGSYAEQTDWVGNVGKGVQTGDLEAAHKSVHMHGQASRTQNVGSCTH